MSAPDWRLKIPERVLLDLPNLNDVCEEIARTHPKLEVADDPATGVETWVGWYPEDAGERREAVASLAPVMAALSVRTPITPISSPRDGIVR